MAWFKVSNMNFQGMFFEYGFSFFTFYEPPKVGSSFITFFISSEMGVCVRRGAQMVVVIRREKRFILFYSFFFLFYSFDLSLKPIERPHLLLALAQFQSLVINCFFGDKVSKKTHTLSLSLSFSLSHTHTHISSGNNTEIPPKVFSQP